MSLTSNIKSVHISIRGFQSQGNKKKQQNKLEAFLQKQIINFYKRFIKENRSLKINIYAMSHSVQN